MEYYKISRDDENWGKLYNDQLQADYTLGMPGVHCPVCNQTWAKIGLSYPAIDLSKTPIAKELTEARVVEYEEFEDIRSSVRQFLPDNFPIFPGTCFGPIKGKITGKRGDFVWLHRWDLLVKLTTFEKLLSTGLLLPEISSPQLQPKLDGQLVQFQIEPHGQLSPNSFVDPDSLICSLCKRDARKVEKIVLVKESISRELDIFRIGNFTTQILVSRRFKDAVDELKLTNIKFKKIDFD